MKPAYRSLLRGLLGLLLLGAVLALASPAQVLTGLRHADAAWLLLGLLAGVASNVVSALRWRALARWLGSDMNLRNAHQWYFQAMGLNALLPGAVVGGDVYRAVMLKRAGHETLASTWSVILDRVSGLWMLGVIGGYGMALCAGVLAGVVGVAPWLLAAVATAGATLLLVAPWLLPLCLRRWRGPGLQWLEPLPALCERPDFARQLLAQVAASAAVQVLSAAALAAGALALGVYLKPAVWAFAVAPIFLMAALPVSVGGWGTREAAAVAALAPFGVAPAAAVGIAVVYGIYALIQGALGALAFGLPAARQTRAKPD